MWWYRWRSWLSCAGNNKTGLPAPACSVWSGCSVCLRRYTTTTLQRSAVSHITSKVNYVISSVDYQMIYPVEPVRARPSFMPVQSASIYPTLQHDWMRFTCHIVDRLSSLINSWSNQTLLPRSKLLLSTTN